MLGISVEQITLGCSHCSDICRTNISMSHIGKMKKNWLTNLHGGISCFRTRYSAWMSERLLWQKYQALLEQNLPTTVEIKWTMAQHSVSMNMNATFPQIEPTQLLFFWTRLTSRFYSRAVSITLNPSVSSLPLSDNHF